MNAHQDLAIRALESMRGDDLIRARRAFSGYSVKEMQQQHGASGQTRQQIISGYEHQAMNVDQAIDWVKAAKNW